MAKPEDLIRLLKLLERQTELQNVQWRERWERDQYEYVGTSARVVVGSRDSDAAYPLILQIYNNIESIIEQCVVYGPGVTPDDVSDATVEPVAQAIRDLYAAVRQQIGGDPVTDLITELEGLPPF